MLIFLEMRKYGQSRVTERGKGGQGDRSRGGHSQNVCVIGVSYTQKGMKTRLNKTVEVCNVHVISGIHCFENGIPEMT
jgi:hypothetical protein